VTQTHGASCRIQIFRIVDNEWIPGGNVIPDPLTLGTWCVMAVRSCSARNIHTPYFESLAVAPTFDRKIGWHKIRWGDKVVGVVEEYRGEG
jgi:hypothetical protein